jgi:hypothetical protein
LGHNNPQKTSKNFSWGKMTQNMVSVTKFPHAEAQRTQRVMSDEKARLLFHEIFLIKYKKYKVGDTKLSNNTAFSTPLRALREVFILIFYILVSSTGLGTEIAV